MAKFDPPWRLDPLKNIVAVAWGSGAFVAIQFQSSATESEGGGSVSSPNPTATLPGAGLSYAIYGSVNTATARNPKPVYHLDKTVHVDGGTVTMKHYFIITTYSDGHGGSGSAGGDIYVTTVKGITYWSGFAGGTDHIGDIGDAAAFILASGWDTFSSELLDTTTSTEDPKDVRSVSDVGVLVISIGQVKKAMHDPDATSFVIEIESGTSGGTFNWGVNVGTYRKMKFDSFTLDGTNQPVNWKAPIDSAGDGADHAKTVRFEIDFTTLAITHTTSE
jgi:hypothetical protein